jgi:cell division protein FtsQ
MTKPLSVPRDVKLMNLTASVLLLAFALLLVLALAYWAVQHQVFAIRAITVTGDVSHNNAVTLRANVAPRLSGTFLTLDLTAARRAFEAVPWVRRAVVRREFPNRLKVQLQEQAAVAYWGAESESRLVNSFGEVFEANVGEVDQEALPRLSGPDEQAAQVLASYQLLQPLFDALDLTLEQVELSPRGGWRARLDTGAVIELGAGQMPEVLARTQRFLKTLTQVTARYARTPEALETADLRYENGYAIRLRGVTTLAQAEAKKVLQ